VNYQALPEKVSLAIFRPDATQTAPSVYIFSWMLNSAWQRLHWQRLWF